MIIPRNGLAPAVEVVLAPGRKVDGHFVDRASVRVRPATAMEMESARAEVAVLAATLVAANEAAEEAVNVLGEEFRDADFLDFAWRNAAIRRFTLLKLAVRCCEDWDGIGAEDGSPLPLTEGNLALLLRDPVIAGKIAAAIEGPVHAEILEKNGSAASLNGGAAAAEPIAPNAGAAPNPAALAAPAATDPTAPRSSTLQ